MKINLIKDGISAFRIDVVEKYDVADLNKWACLKTFQDRWNLGSNDLALMYDKALTSQQSGRLWGGSRYSAKSMMISFFKLNPDYVSSAFRDLFDVSKDITLRIDRFRFHCDELLSSLPPGSKKETSHYHNRYIVSLYLSLRYPELYCLYDYEKFRKALGVIQTKNIPESYEMDRFFKICNILHTFLDKDESIQEIMKTHLESSKYYSGPSQFLTYDFYQYLAR